MQVNREQVKKLVEMSWEIACTCNLPGADPMFPGVDPMGQQLICGLRVTIFGKLLDNLLPKNSQVSGDFNTKVSQEKEPWQQ